MSTRRLSGRFYWDRATRRSKTTRRACHRQYRRDSNPRSVTLSLQSVSFSMATRRRFRRVALCQPPKRKRKLLSVRPVSTPPGTATIACQQRERERERERGESYVRPPSIFLLVFPQPLQGTQRNTLLRVRSLSPIIITERLPRRKNKREW